MHKLISKKFKAINTSGLICLLLLFSLFNLREKAWANEENSHYHNFYEMGNEAYSRGNLDSAVYYYSSIVHENYEAANLYYNLGNAYYKMQNLPQAIFYYEKALKLDPDDKDINFNLQLANQQIIDKIEPLPEFFLKKWWDGIIASASVDSWARWTLILVFYSLLMFVFFMLSWDAGYRKLFFISGIAGICFASLTFSFALKQEKNLTRENQAIVFSPSVTTKSSPAETSTNLFVIHEGTKVKILETVNGWVKISLADGNIGWIKTDDIKAF